MFGIEQMSRRCLIELQDGSKILAILTIPKPTKPIFPEKMEREFIEVLTSRSQIWSTRLLSVT